MGPGDEVVGVEDKVGPGVEGADCSADQQDAEDTVDE
jgi:hypothetical protein